MNKLKELICNGQRAGVLVLALGVSACGDDGSPVEPTADASADATPTTDAATSTATSALPNPAVSASDDSPDSSAPRATESPTVGTPSSSTEDLVPSDAGASENDAAPIAPTVTMDADLPPKPDAGHEVTCTDGCLIDGQCLDPGAPNPDNPCTQCEPASNPLGWSPRDDGTACDDGLSCNGEDTCQAGSCAHAGSPCGSHETCDEAASASFECHCAPSWTGATCERCLLYVAPDGDDTNSGGSWSEAFASVDTALSAATDGGCEIWVAAGTYYPVADPYGDPHYASFHLVSGVDLYGGFAGNESSLEQRDINANETILSGDLAQDDAAEELDTLLENSVRVVTGADSARIDGFTITAGNASAFGGGLYINQTSPTVENCRIVGNYGSDGAGMYIYNGSPVIANCSFENNVAGAFGGGALVEGSDDPSVGPTFTGCSFANNTAWRGGAISLRATSMSVTNSTFTENTAASGGGAISSESSDYSVQGCSFTSNNSDQGGAIYDTVSNVEVSASTFIGNSAQYSGGAVSADRTLLALYGVTCSGNTAASGGAVYAQSATATMRSSIFYANSANNGSGGAIATVAGSVATIADSNLSSNTAPSGGGALAVAQSDVTVTASTLSNNTASSGGGIEASDSSSVTAFGCALQGNTGNYGGAIYTVGSMLLLEGSVLSNNSASWNGGALFMSYAPTSRITNTTLSANSATLRGGAAAIYASDLLITNSILWGNNAGDTFPEIYGSVTASHSDIQGWCIEWETCMDGNRNIDPMFVAPQLGNFSLGATSPVVDVGDSLAVETDVADLDADDDTSEPVPFDQIGNPRISGAFVDLGAYEYAQ
jgi:predicted outer membrane repeat protein